MNRKNHVAYSHCWGKRLRECIHINHFLTAINTKERRQRLTMTSQFTIIVIFNNIVPTLFISPAQDLITTTCRHGDSCWEMVIRTNMGNIDMLIMQFTRHNTISIDIGINTFNTILLIDLQQLLISRIFNTITIIIPQQLNKNSIEIFSPSANNNLIRINTHATK